jgi:hypothetical protein
MTARAMLVLAVALLPACATGAEPVRSDRAACEAVKSRVAAAWDVPDGVIAFCDSIPADSSPAEFYVMALHSNRICEGICSTNMGWYAIHKATGRVYEWDVGEWKLGPPLRQRR